MALRDRINEAFAVAAAAADMRDAEGKEAEAYDLYVSCIEAFLGIIPELPPDQEATVSLFKRECASMLQTAEALRAVVDARAASAGAGSDRGAGGSGGGSKAEEDDDAGGLLSSPSAPPYPSHAVFDDEDEWPSAPKEPVSAAATAAHTGTGPAPGGGESKRDDVEAATAAAAAAAAGGVDAGGDSKRADASDSGAAPAVSGAAAEAEADDDVTAALAAAVAEAEAERHRAVSRSEAKAAEHAARADSAQAESAAMAAELAAMRGQLDALRAAEAAARRAARESAQRASRAEAAVAAVTEAVGAGVGMPSVVPGMPSLAPTLSRTGSVGDTTVADAGNGEVCALPKRYVASPPRDLGRYRAVEAGLETAGRVAMWTSTRPRLPGDAAGAPDGGEGEGRVLVTLYRFPVSTAGALADLGLRMSRLARLARSNVPSLRSISAITFAAGPAPPGGAATMTRVAIVELPAPPRGSVTLDAWLRGGGSGTDKGAGAGAGAGADAGASDSKSGGAVREAESKAREGDKARPRPVWVVQSTFLQLMQVVSLLHASGLPGCLHRRSVFLCPHGGGGGGGGASGAGASEGGSSSGGGGGGGGDAVSASGSGGAGGGGASQDWRILVTCLPVDNGDGVVPELSSSGGAAVAAAATPGPGFAGVGSAASDMYLVGAWLFEALWGREPVLMPGADAPEVPHRVPGAGAGAHTERITALVRALLSRDAMARLSAFEACIHPAMTSSVVEDMAASRSIVAADAKREALYECIAAMRLTGGRRLHLSVRRGMLVDTTITAIMDAPAGDLVRRLSVKFDGEEGIDAGGLTSELYQQFFEALFSSSCALFETCKDFAAAGTGGEGTTEPLYLPTARAADVSGGAGGAGAARATGRGDGGLRVRIRPGALERARSGSDSRARARSGAGGGVGGGDADPDADDPLAPSYEGVGRMLAKSVFDGHPVPARFAPSVYKYLLGIEPNILDLEAFDPVAARSCRQLFEYDAETLESLCVTFGDVGGSEEEEVTAANVQRYIAARVQWTLVGSRRSALAALKRGFEAIPIKSNLRLFTATELSALVCGSQHVAAADVVRTLRFEGFPRGSALPRLFRRVVMELSGEECRRFLVFVTAQSVLPRGRDDPARAGAVDEEEEAMRSGSGDLSKINVRRHPDKASYCVAHTCFNRLDCPDLDDIAELRRRIRFSIDNLELAGFGEQ